MELLRDFVDYLRSIQRSDSTVQGYISDLEIAFVWCLKNNDNKFFVNWTKRNIVAFQNYLLRQNENSPARIRRLKATLSSLSNFIESVLDDEFPNFRNIVNKVENPVNKPVREKTILEVEEVESLLTKLAEMGEHEKACYLALAAYSGRRKSELCRFKVSDFSAGNLVCDGALYKSAPIKTKGRGGGKMIPCYTLAKKFTPYLDAWMNQWARLGLESEWLFPSRSNPKEHIKVTTANSWASACEKLLGRPFYLHSLRHFYTSYLVRSGIPDSVIQSIVGWESSDMVRLYTDIDVDEQLGKYFSGGEIRAVKQKGFSDL